jgi:hypothetical protein
MILGFPDPDPDPDPSIIMLKYYSYYFVTLIDLFSLKNDVNVPSKSNKPENLLKLGFCWHLEGQ